ncbi:hypothetical protein E1A91_A13G209400v1 [Gossypium mustelinum]|uniref:RING-type E3 ubiquitin transferase n=1 Tax=Gossypium mustelinum TaxID=34275 RepID=A0A5D2WMG1_GOSMU|nr:hypothetical protein E1A91_A13G209400v1 [Gossypium mustelinum]TYJ02172.1 hypothetical protein E1A91_A13G209400v1 [Gossypium mustelinum]
MDEYGGKRGVDGLGKGSGLVLNDHVNNRERNARFCNRIGCGARLNSMNDTRNGCSRNGKGIIGSSSRVNPTVSNNRKSSINPQKKLSSQLETSSVRDELQVSELIPQSESGNVDSWEVRSSSVASSRSSRRNMIQRSPSASVGLATRANASRYGLRNLRCKSISDVVPSGCLSSDSSIRRREDTVKTRNSDGEGSSSGSSRGKKLSGSSLEGQNNGPSHGVFISADSRQARNWRDSGVAYSVRTRRSNSSYGRRGFPNQANGNRLSSNEYHVIMPQVPRSDIPINLNDPVSTEIASTRASSYSQPDNISESLLDIMPSSPSEIGVNRDSFWHYNIDGTGEVLLALERIEQDEDLTHEQLLALETTLFLDGLNFYDQYSNMRLDIDNMSYEELLDLEERMGNVSTVLSEEALSKRLMKSIYEGASVDCDGEKDVTKCSICQEEYVNGDEVGMLQCEHRYHVTCVQNWLQVKNWCPICKFSPHN